MNNGTHTDPKGRTLRQGERYRPDGRYEYRYKDDEGKTKSIYSDRLTRSDKGKKQPLRDMIVAIGRGEEEPAKKSSTKYTVNTLYKERMESVNVRNSTVNTYNVFFGKHIEGTIGTKDIRKLTAGDLRKYYVSLTKSGVSSNTVKYVHMILAFVYAYAVELEIVDKNCANIAKSSIPKAKREKKRSLSLRQQEMFIREAYTGRKSFEPYRNLFTFLLGTGCRISEAAGLQWDDVNLEKKEICVQRNLNWGKIGGINRFYFGETKTDAGKRTIPMMQPVYEVLQKMSREPKPNLSVDGKNNFVFVSKSGNPIKDESVNYIIKCIVEECNRKETDLAKAENRTPDYIEKITAHTLRHTFCTRMCEIESNIKVIQTIMGHSNFNITMDIYADATGDSVSSSMNKFSGEATEKLFKY